MITLLISERVKPVALSPGMSLITIVDLLSTHKSQSGVNRQTNLCSMKSRINIHLQNRHLADCTICRPVNIIITISIFVKCHNVSVVSAMPRQCSVCVFHGQRLKFKMSALDHSHRLFWSTVIPLTLSRPSYISEVYSHPMDTADQTSAGRSLWPPQ